LMTIFVHDNLVSSSINSVIYSSLPLGITDA